MTGTGEEIGDATDQCFDEARFGHVQYALRILFLL